MGSEGLRRDLGWGGSSGCGGYLGWGGGHEEGLGFGRLEGREGTDGENTIKLISFE